MTKYKFKVILLSNETLTVSDVVAVYCFTDSNGNLCFADNASSELVAAFHAGVWRSFTRLEAVGKAA